MFSEDGALMWRLSPWQPWPGSVSARYEPFDFRMTATASESTVFMRIFIVSIDVPDLIESVGDVLIESAGRRLPLAQEYHALAAVNLTLQGPGDEAVTARAIDKNPQLGPLVRCYNAEGEPVSGIVDAVIQGY